jgi:hypothetical protein
MTYFLISIEILMPIIVLILVGYFLKRTGIADDHFCAKSSAIVFKIALPVMLFYNMVNADVAFVIDRGSWIFVGVACGMVLVSFFTAVWIAEKMGWDKPTKGAFIQGTYRSNYIIIAYAVLESLFGDAAILRMSLLTAFVIPLFNVLAVIILTYHDPEVKKIHPIEVLKSIVKNPLIISIVLGLVIKSFNVEIPTMINNSLSSIRGMATPLALINIGAMFSFSINVQDRKPLVMSALLKVVLIPVVFTGVAIVMGYEGPSLGILFMLFASPTAATSYIMAKAMHSNDTLAASIVVVTTAASFVTIFIGIVLMKAVGLF